MDKNKLFETVEAKADVLTALSDKIWEYAELSMLEYKSAAAYIQILKEEGYDYSYIHYTGVAPWYEKLGYQTFAKWNKNGVL